MFANFLTILRPEDPRAMRAFKEALKGLSWDQANLAESLDVLFQAVDDLAIAEVLYYYRRRGTRAWISGISRFAAWVFGTIGLLLPLFAATKHAVFSNFEDYGYVFLGLAASCLGANSLFGGTEGHVRFVSTQLEIERLITQKRIAWFEYLALQDGNDRENSKAFALILDYANALHELTIEETGRWGVALLDDLAKYQNQLAENRVPLEK